MADVQHIFSSALDPVGAPTGLGHHHINTATSTAWYSTGTSTVADWQRAPEVSSGSGAPSSTPKKEGDIYIDTTNDSPYFAVGTASSADWSAGGGSGGSGSTGPVLDADTTYYTVPATAGTQTVTIDETTRYHKVTVPSDSSNAPTVSIVLPNSTDLADADGTKTVEFDIIVTSAPFVTGQGGHFDLLTSINITVNGAASVLASTGYTETESISTRGVAISSESGPAWDFNDVRSWLSIKARIQGDSVYMLSVERDAEAQMAD